MGIERIEPFYINIDGNTYDVLSVLIHCDHIVTVKFDSFSDMTKVADYIDRHERATVSFVPNNQQTLLFEVVGFCDCEYENSLQLIYENIVVPDSLRIFNL